MATSGVWPLVGREAEMAVVLRLLRRPDSVGVVIAGETGTGKTRLAREALAAAERDRLPTERVVASHAAASITLGAFAPLLPPLEGRSATAELLQVGLAALTSRASPSGRLVLLVDDAHLLDDASATLVHQAATSGRVLVVATARSGEPAPDAIAALWKDRLAERLELQDLSREETAHLLDTVLGGEIDPAITYRLWDRTGGNPLFLRELVVGAIRTGALRTIDGVWSIEEPLTAPPSLREIVGARLAGVPEEARKALASLAVAGTLSVDDITALHGDVVAETLETHGLAEVVVGDRRRLLRLTHPIYGDVLRAGLHASAAGRVAGRLAVRLEEAGMRRRDDVLRLVTYELAAGRVPDAHRLRPAAVHAYQAGDFAAAERLARLAPTSDHETRVLLARILDETGRQEEAADLVVSLPLEEFRPATRLTAALIGSDALYFGLGREDQALALLGTTEGALSAQHEVGELTANRGWLQLHGGHPAAALATVAGLQHSDDPLVRAAGAIVTSRTLGILGRVTDALEWSDRALAPADEDRPLAASRHTEFVALVRGYALLYGGSLLEADGIATRALEGVLAGRPTFQRAHWLSLLGWVRQARGDMVSATGWFQQAAALQRRLGQLGLLRWDLAGLALAAAQAGACDQAAAALEEHDRLGDRPERLLAPEVARARAWTLVGQGHLGDALRTLDEGARTARQSGATTLEAACLHDLARLGDASSAAPALFALGGGSLLTDARTEHAAALVDGDVERLGEAADRFEALGALLLAAETHADAARAHRSRGQARDARRHRLRSLDLAGRCGEVRTPALAVDEDVSPLTRREREVVTMAAGGLSSRQIAEQLVVSVRTVDNLLHRAYGKLGVAGRHEAAAALGLSPGGSGRGEPTPTP